MLQQQIQHSVLSMQTINPSGGVFTFSQIVCGFCMRMVFSHGVQKHVDVGLRNPISRGIRARRCDQVVNAGKRATEEGVVHQAQQCRAEKGHLAPITIQVKAVYATQKSPTPSKNQAKLSNLLIYAEIQKLLKTSEYTQIKQITHYSHSKACL